MLRGLLLGRQARRDLFLIRLKRRGYFMKEISKKDSLSDCELLFGSQEINISCEEIRDILHGKGQGRGSDTILLDVREEWEHRYVRFPRSILISLSRLPEKLEELPRDKKIIVYCHTGVRSLLACFLLSQNGFQSIKNLEGGIDFYAARINPRLPRYSLEPDRRPSLPTADETKIGDLDPDSWGEGIAGQP